MTWIKTLDSNRDTTPARIDNTGCKVITPVTRDNRGAASPTTGAFNQGKTGGLNKNGDTITPVKRDNRGSTITHVNRDNRDKTNTPVDCDNHGSTITPGQRDNRGTFITPINRDNCGSTISPVNSDNCGITITPPLNITPVLSDNRGSTIATTDIFDTIGKGGGEESDMSIMEDLLQLASE